VRFEEVDIEHDDRVECYHDVAQYKCDFPENYDVESEFFGKLNGRTIKTIQ